MRHRKKLKKIGVTSSHRKALLSNLVRELILHHRIRTTHLKAKEAGKLANKLITLAKKNTLHSRRQVVSKIQCEKLTAKLFDTIKPRFELVHGGYTRIIKEGPRPGDGAEMVYLEFSKNVELEEKKTVKKTNKKTSGKKKNWDDVSVVKKDSISETKSKPKKESKAKKVDSKIEDDQSEVEDKSKKGGFLTSLRTFLKGDEKK